MKEIMISLKALKAEIINRELHQKQQLRNTKMLFCPLVIPIVH